ncbi:glutamate receptor-interacting protein 2-like [Physella acuta]|uniref:glutamate receptor-interacting protein 2-like n=1 Tax=Physella acuta TaxID=109671 RepID=UPI0027DC5C30|nr:glutamate receptor-interacting protein 2-like [Physella acuta]XP_059153791.1 glutamate receptor-interacting protein 2-like [Physella acuta]
MPSWRPNCLRGSIYNDAPHYSIVPKADNSNQDINPDRKGSILVELQKREGCGLGLTISGGADKAHRCHVSNLRPGSVADRCDALRVGDQIISINDIRTANLRHEEITNLLKNAGSTVTLEIDYEIPDSGSGLSNVYSQVHEVILEKEVSGFGMILRGGMVDAKRTYPITVVVIRHGGPADREGSIRVGDRINAINGYKLNHHSLQDIMGILSQCESSASFTVSYDVAIVDEVEKATGPVMVKVERPPGVAIGITLSEAKHEGKPCLNIDHVSLMSIADRSGVLHPGDLIMAIDGVESMSEAEASQRLKSGTENVIHFEILPSSLLENSIHQNNLKKNSLSSSLSAHALPSAYCNIPYNVMRNKSSTIGGYADHTGGYFKNFTDSSSVGVSQFGTLNMRKTNLWRNPHQRRAASCMSIASSCASVLSATNQVCHSESLEVILFANHKGLGLTLKGGVFATAPLSQPPSITFVEPRSPAEKCGVLQEGDRVLAINGVETTGHTLEEVNHLLRESRPRCLLLVEFDVTDSVTPSSGVYFVKLGKRAGDTGITVNATPSKQGNKDVMFISDVRRGSVAHRTGSIQPGDKLLAINDVSLENYSPDDVMHLLELPDDIVKLKLRRDDPDEGHEGCIIYTVELQRFGGPLGITISGTEDPLDPIIISELTPLGLADRTGAIHVGDRLLAVSGDTTKNKPLSEAIRMLQSAGDVVTLKIARPDPSIDSSHHYLHPFGLKANWGSTAIPSIDSAVASWSSSVHDMSVHENLTDSCKKVDNASDWDRDSHSSSSDLKREQKDEDDMEEWVKTLKDFDMGSESEMLQQIGLSLKERNHLIESGPSENGGAHENGNTSKNGSAPENGCPPPLPAKSDSLINRIKQSAKSQNDHTAKTDSASKITAVTTKRYDPPPVPASKTTSSVNKTSDQPPATASKTSRGPPPPIKPKPKIAPKPVAKSGHIHTIYTPAPIQLQRVKLEKTCVTEDFGFSLSDGLYEKGVYISGVREGSVAHKAGLKELDRVLQVNRVKTRDFDCRLTVPLFSQSDKRVTLIVCRNPLLLQDKGTEDTTNDS